MTKRLTRTFVRRLVGVAASLTLGVTGAVLPTRPALASTPHVSPYLACDVTNAYFMIRVHYTTSGNRLSVNRVEFHVTDPGREDLTKAMASREARSDGWWDFYSTPEPFYVDRFAMWWPESLHVATQSRPYVLDVNVEMYYQRTGRYLQSANCRKAFWT